jgi:hypothetical protein
MRPVKKPVDDKVETSPSGSPRSTLSISAMPSKDTSQYRVTNITSPVKIIVGYKLILVIKIKKDSCMNRALLLIA